MKVLLRFFALVLVPVAFLLTGCFSAPHADGQAKGAAPAGRLVSIPISDPTLGISPSVYLAPAGFHGSVRMDRTTDAMANGQATLAANLTSANGQAEIILLPAPYRTYGGDRNHASAMPGNPPAQPNVALVRFTSTIDLLKQHVLPALGLTGKINLESRTDAQMSAKARQGMLAQGFEGPISDGALVLVSSGGRDTIVIGTTTGFWAGTDKESTTTRITLIKAPSGQPVMDVFSALVAIRQPEASQQWRVADDKYNKMKMDQMYEQGRRDSAISQAQGRAIVAQGQENVRQIQQQGAARDAEFARSQQRISDHGALVQGRLRGETTTFKWCSATDVQYTVDSQVSPGPGYHRCN